MRHIASESGGPSAGTFAPSVLDDLIAPGASAFTRAEIPDMSAYHAQSKWWVANFFLNSVLRARYKPPLNAYLYNYFRRCEAAYREHDLARSATLEFLRRAGQSPAHYATALTHWEVFLGQSWHALKILGFAMKVQVYKQGIGSIEERVNTRYNQMKHAESKIREGEIGQQTVAVWMTNEGLTNGQSCLTYSETGEVLKEIAKWADVYSDPLTAVQKLAKVES